MSEPLSAPAGFRGRFLLAEGERTPYSAASGILASLPRAAAVPDDADDLALLVRWAADRVVPLVPRGAGTGMPGGNVGPGLVVDLMTAFRGVDIMDPNRRRATVRPGTTLDELNRAAAQHGLVFPVDPSSSARCSLGGMLANNSAGSHSVRYGATRDWVEALDLVLADGTRAQVQRGARPENPRLAAILERIDRLLEPERERIETDWPRVRKNSSGYALREYLRSGDAVDLLVGSEGTLALIVGATLRLAPLPTHRGVALLEFNSLERAGEAVQALLPTHPATCEMLDRTFLELVRNAGADADYPLRPGLEAILLVEMEGASEQEVAQRLDRALGAATPFADHASTAIDLESQHRFWAVRHAASPIIARQAGSRVSMQFIEDGVVPVDRLPDYVRMLRRVLERHHLPAVIFGHAGDGNLHVNPLVDVSAAGWQTTLDEILSEVAQEVARLGGTLSGEHGDGRLRAPFLETIWGPAMVGLFRQIKQLFDPHGILNPGVKLPLPGQRPFDALRSFR